jgi:hypothetical protein
MKSQLIVFATNHDSSSNERKKVQWGNIYRQIGTEFLQKKFHIVKIIVLFF